MIVETIPDLGPPLAPTPNRSIPLQRKRIRRATAIRPVRLRCIGRPPAPIVVGWIGSSPPLAYRVADAAGAGVCRRGVPLLLDWLADQPGDTWQQRWDGQPAPMQRAKTGTEPGGGFVEGATIPRTGWS